MLSMSTNLEEALLATKMTYFGGCFIQPLVFFSILSIFKIELRKIVKVFFYALSMIIYSFVLTIGFNQSFYKAATFEIAEDGYATVTDLTIVTVTPDDAVKTYGNYIAHQVLANSITVAPVDPATAVELDMDGWTLPVNVEKV